MITLKDIAREAGVSITTVSNVIHHKPNRASPELVARIQELIRRRNYVPSMTARTLANNTSPIIGVINHVIHRRGGGFIADPFHSTFIGGIEDCARRKHYFIMVRTVEDALGLEIIHRNWNLAGIILAGMFQDDFFRAVRQIGVPFSLIDSYIDLPDVYNVGLEDQKGGYLATRYLLERGHRVIAFTSPYIKKHGVVEKRLQGYKQALTEFGVPFDRTLVFEQEITVEEGMSLGRRLSMLKDITAIFASADILAAGIMAGLHEMGIHVPNDKSIVGFDDNYLCQITCPRLTTIHQDAEEKGVIAAEMVIHQICGQSSWEKQVILPVRLVERESVRTLGNNH
jgi:LacI family transcriptional regulator